MIFNDELEYFFINYFWHSVFVLLFGIYILLMAKLYDIDMIVWIMMIIVSSAAAFIGVGILIATNETRD